MLFTSLKKFFVSKTKFKCFKKMSIFSYSLLTKIFKIRSSSRLVFLIKIVYNIVLAPPAHPFFLKQGGVNLSGESEKLEKGGGSIVQGQVLLQGGSWHFSYLIFSRFIIFAFRNYFTLCKIVLCIWRKTIFFCDHNFRKKGYSKLSKNEPENIP